MLNQQFWNYCRAAAETGGGATGASNIAQSGAAADIKTGDAAAKAGGPAVATAGNKSDLISKARQELESWFESHFRQSNALSQDTPLFNAVHAAKESLHAILGERG